jgi:hypothetical protein
MLKDWVEEVAEVASNPDTLQLGGIKVPMPNLAEATQASGLLALQLIEEDMTTLCLLRTLSIPRHPLAELTQPTSSSTWTRWTRACQVA